MLYPNVHPIEFGLLRVCQTVTFDRLRKARACCSSRIKIHVEDNTWFCGRHQHLTAHLMGVWIWVVPMRDPNPITGGDSATQCGSQSANFGLLRCIFLVGKRHLE